MGSFLNQTLLSLNNLDFFVRISHGFLLFATDYFDMALLSMTAISNICFYLLDISLLLLNKFIIRRLLFVHRTERSLCKVNPNIS